MTEGDLQRRIMLALSERGCRVFRNNTGRLQDATGRWVRFGLCVGSSDIIGWTKDGRFLAVEVKAPHGKMTTAQHYFLAAVRAAGGVAIEARSVEDAVAGVTLHPEKAGRTVTGRMG